MTGRFKYLPPDPADSGRTVNAITAEEESRGKRSTRPSTYIYPSPLPVNFLEIARLRQGSTESASDLSSARWIEFIHNPTSKLYHPPH